MSVVINENLKLNECIYDVIKKEPLVFQYTTPKVIPYDPYRSIHSDRVRCERKRAQEGHRTMGYAKYPIRSPCDFLKKRTGIVYVRKPDPCAHLPKPKLKPPLPLEAVVRRSTSDSNKGAGDISRNKKVPEKPKQLEEEKPNDKNESKQMCVKICQCCNNNMDACFCVPEVVEVPKDKSKSPTESKSDTSCIKKQNIILRNIMSVVRAQPKQPVPRMVDDRTGRRQMVKKSGVVPQFIYRKSYGKTPNYILKFINDKMTKERRETDTDILSNQPKCRYVTQDERDKLLQGLKKNWEEMQSRYQGLPILTDTIPKMIRKTQMEAKLLELEKDIRLIEQHPYIYVYDD